MPDEIYEVVSQAARYWFLFLMALIAWRSYRWLARDRKQRRKRLKLLPDAGYVGELVVLKGNAELPQGLALPVAREGVLGSVRGDDLYVPVRGVQGKHLWFAFDEDNGLRVQAYGRRAIAVDGQPLAGRRSHTYLTHGSRLTVGEAELRLRMFAGFEQAGVRNAQAVGFAADEELVGGDSAPPPVWPPEQLAAMQQAQAMQWYAAMQTQGQTPVPMAAMQAQGQTLAPMAAMQAPTSPLVVATQGGQFALPPKITAQTSILQGAAEGDAETFSGMVAEPSHTPAPRRYRGNPLPPLGRETTAAPEPDTAFSPTAGESVQTQPYTPTQDGGADALWARTHGEWQDTAYRPSVATPPQGGEPPAASPTFAPRVTFYPPLMEDEPIGYGEAALPLYPPDGELGGEMPPTDSPEDEQTAFFSAQGALFGAEPWPEGDSPLPDEPFAGGLPPYPPYAPSDEPYEYADEDEAPRSLYVEPDEAAQAKRVLWDKYLKGGHR